MICPGRVTGVFAEKRSYDVLLDGKTTVEATIIETGVDFTVLRNHRVACIFLKNVGWKIIGKYRTPKNKGEKEEETLTIAERIAEEQDWLNSILTGRSLDAGPSYRKSGEDPVLEGEVALKSLINNSLVSIFNDGSILARVTNALLLLISKTKNTILFSAKRLIFRGIPGIKVDAGLKEKGENQNPDTTVKPKVSVTAALSSDPAKPKEIDFFLEAGDVDPKTAQYGASLKTQGQALVRGLKFLMKNFSIAEADNDKGEVRLTYLQSAEKQDPEKKPFQVRMNEDEVVLSWGSQFISLTSAGLMIKANRIGLAGPIDMWDPSAVLGFKQEIGFPDPLVPDPVTIEWYAEGQPAGIRISKSVYFGGEEEPSILKGFVNDRYVKDMQAIFEHTHVSPTSGGTTSPMALNSPDFYPNVLLGTADPVAFMWLSLVAVSS